MLELSIVRTLQFRLSSGKRTTVQSSGADFIRSGALLNELNKKENTKLQLRNKSYLSNKITSQKPTDDSEKETTSQYSKYEIEKFVNTKNPSYLPSEQQCYNDVLHINEKINTENLII